MAIFTPNDEIFFIDWTKCPKKTTHVCALGFNQFIDGVPLFQRNWEKWVPIFKKSKHTGEYRIYEWNSEKWEEYSSTHDSNIFPETRIAHPRIQGFQDPKGFFRVQ